MTSTDLNPPVETKPHYKIIALNTLGLNSK